jgi:hypothetical protein
MISTRTKKGQFSLRRLALTSLFSFILVIGIAPLGRLNPSAAAIQYNNVQVFIQTQGSELSPYTLTAYNSTGSLISSSQSNYPAFSLELPSGTYLLTVTAVNQSSSKYYWSYSTEEYGYQLVQISSSTTLNMKTIPLQDIGNSKITIQAKYVNGTLVSGAEVDASIVGLMYWWPFPTPYASSSITLWNQTDSSGTATLTVPSVPVIVTAWKSVYVNLPTNETTVVRNIGGENVNVTVFWEPMYVGLSGQTLIIPPSTSGEITLHVEQMPYYWYGGVVPLMGTATVQGAPGVYSTATVANSQGMIPASAYNQQQQMQASGNSGIPPTGSSQGSTAGSLQPTQIPQILQVSQPSPALTPTDLVIAVSAIGALIIAAASFVFVILRGRKHLTV